MVNEVFVGEDTQYNQLASAHLRAVLHYFNQIASWQHLHQNIIVFAGEVSCVAKHCQEAILNNILW